MANFVYDNAIVHLLLGEVAIAHNTKTYGVLLQNVEPNQLSDKHYSDIKNSAGHEIAAVGGGTYALGGGLVHTELPVDATSNVVGLKTGGDLVFTVATGYTLECYFVDIQYAPSSSTADTNPLLCHIDVGHQSVIATGSPATLTFQWNASGIFAITL